MRAAVVQADGSVELTTVPDPVPDTNDVTIRVRGCGLCGTDIHTLRGDFGIDRFPQILGHEAWGEIVATGPAIKRFAAGDYVAINPSISCGQCPECQRGRLNMCQNWDSLGKGRPGAWADLLCVPAENVYPLGQDFPVEVAPLIEPVACAIRGLRRLRPSADEAALVIGAGTMGVLTAILLEAQGVGPVTLTDVSAEKQHVVRTRFGLDVRSPDQVDRKAYPWVVEASGSISGTSSALASVARGGTVLVFGVADPAARASISPYQIYNDELTIIGSRAVLHSFGQAVETTRQHATQLLPLITDRYPLEEIRGGLSALKIRKTIKIVVEPE